MLGDESKPGIAILNRGHGQKTPKRFDPGAVHGELREVDLVTSYFGAAERHLRIAGVDVYLLWDGSYTSRHTRANQIARDNPDRMVLHVFGHVNSHAKPGRYGAYFYDGRSLGGKQAAIAIAACFRAFPEFDRVRSIATQPTGWTSRANSVLSGCWRGPTNISGVVLEPYFIQQPAHRSLTDPAGAERIGEALSIGILSYLGMG